MRLDEPNSAMESLEISLKIAVAASFTAEPVLGTLAFWMRELGLNAAIEFAPYNQVFQELLNPGSLLSQNHGGMNVILLRPEDWLRFNPSAKNPEKARVLLDAMPAISSKPCMLQYPVLELLISWHFARCRPQS